MNHQEFSQINLGHACSPAKEPTVCKQKPTKAGKGRKPASLLRGGRSQTPPPAALGREGTPCSGCRARSCRATYLERQQDSLSPSGVLQVQKKGTGPSGSLGDPS